MTFMIAFGGLMISAYLAQIFLGMKQIKHFNEIYQALRRQGKVAIGRRAGKIKAGTLVLFAVDEQGKILAAQKMQGVTVLAKFHAMPAFVGQDIHYLDQYHPLVRAENKLVCQAIENAREIYLRVAVGNYQEDKPLSPFMGVSVQLQIWKTKIENKVKRSVG